MPITLNTEIGGETSNSYVTLAYADDYFDPENVFNALQAETWMGLTDAAKMRLLVRACSVIESIRFTYKYGPDRPRFSFIPVTYPINTNDGPFKYNPYQSLQFPRNMDFLDDGTLYIPEDVKMAQCEQALYMVTVDKSVIENRLQGVAMDRVTLGGLGATQEYNSSGIALSPDAYELLTKYIVGKGNLRLGRA